MTSQDAIRQYIDTHIPENHRQGDGCWDAAQRAMDAPKIDWHEVLLDALCASDGGNNPFYSDEDDTVALASELAAAVKDRLAVSS